MMLRGLADTAVGTQTLTETTTYAELNTAVDAVVTAVATTTCADKACLDVAGIQTKKDTAWSAIVPSAATVQSVFDTATTNIKSTVSGYCFDISNQLLKTLHVRFKLITPQ